MLLLLGLLLLLLLLLLRLLLRIGIVISIVVIGAGIGIGKGVASQQSPGPRAVSEKKALASRASPTCLRRRLCAPLGDALRSCPKLGGARRRSEELAPAASATCERSASMAIRRRSWSRERPRLRRAHALPVRSARVPLPAGSAPFSAAP